MDTENIRTFDSGATRSSDAGKPDYEGYISPIVLERYADYMLKHSVQADGSVRASDNWQKGIPLDSFMKSLIRHTVDVWLEHRGQATKDGIQDALCAVVFNSMGYLHELLKLEGNT